jgi:hypothetical protein
MSLLDTFSFIAAIFAGVVSGLAFGAGKVKAGWLYLILALINLAFVIL